MFFFNLKINVFNIYGQNRIGLPRPKQYRTLMMAVAYIFSGCTYCQEIVYAGDDTFTIFPDGGATLLTRKIYSPALMAALHGILRTISRSRQPVDQLYDAVNI